MKDFLKLLSLSLALFIISYASDVNAQCTANFSWYPNSSNNSIILLGTISSSTHYSWDIGNGITLIGNGAIYYSYGGNHQICLTVTDSSTGCTDTYCDMVSIPPPPVAPCNTLNASINTSINNNMVTYTTTIAGGTAPYTYQWFFNSYNNWSSSTSANPPTQPAILSNHGTVARLYIEDANGCHFSVYDSIYNSGPCANAIANFLYNSTPSGVNFYAAVSGFSGSTTYFWDFGNGTNSSTINPNAILPNGWHNVCLTVSDSACSDTFCDSIYVNNIGNPCANDTVSFSFNSTPSGVNFYAAVSGFSGSTTYFWDFGNGTNSSTINPNAILPNGWHNVCLTVSDSACSDTFCDSIYVNNIGNPCANDTVSFSFNSTISGVTFYPALSGFSGSTTYFWDFGNGTNSSTINPNAILPNGWHNVCLTVSDSACSDTFCDSVYVNNISNPCAGMSATFNTGSTYNTGLGLFNAITTGGTVTSYFWDFGDGAYSSHGNTSHHYNTIGNYTVVLTVTFANGCIETHSRTVICNISTPCANNSVNISHTTSGNTVNFTSTFTGLNYGPGAYNPDMFWYFDGVFGAQGPTAQHTFPNNIGTVHLVVMDWDNCYDVDFDTLYFNGGTNPCANTSASFQHTSTPSAVNFTSTATGFSSNASYNWTFGNSLTSNATNPSIQLANGWHNVCLTVQDSACSETFCDSVHIYNNPCTTNPINVTFSSNVVSGTTVNFTSNITGGHPPYSYYWSFDWMTNPGGSSTLAHPSYTYSSTAIGGQAKLVIFDSLGCHASLRDTVYLSPPSPCAGTSASFTYNSASNGVSFSPTVTGFYPNATYSWNFGNGSTSNTVSPTAQLPNGWHNVCLTIQDSACSETFCDSVFVNNNPCAAVVVNYTYNSISSGVNFTSSIGGFGGNTSYTWNFGNGTTSNLFNPTGIQLANGWHNVCLTVSDSLCSDTFCDSVYVNNTIIPCVHNKMTLLLDFDNYAYETSWDIRDANGNVVENGSGYTLNQSGTSLLLSLCLPTGCYDFNIYDAYGDGICCLYGNGQYQLLDATGTILVSGGSFGYSETTNFCVGGATNPCTGFTTSFQHTANNNVLNFAATTSFGPSAQYLWDFGDNTTGTGTNPVHTYSNTTSSGYYNVCLTAIDSQGCVAMFYDSVFVIAPSCLHNQVTLTLNFDNFAYETSWDLVDATGNIIYSSAAYTQADNGTTLSSNLCLPSACYDFNIYDAYGDGMCCNWGNGSYSITDATGNVLVNGASFGNLETTNFCVGGANNPCGNFNATYIYHEGLNGEVFFQGQSNSSAGNLSYFWSFGNGNTSTLANPSFTYTTNGFYGACVTITDSSGCSDTYCDSFTVSGNTGTSSGCAGMTVGLNIVQSATNPYLLSMQPVVNNASTNGQFQFAWDFGDNTGTFGGYPAHLYNNYGSYVVCIMAIDTVNGCTDTYCDTITLDSAGNFSRALDYKDVKPGFSVNTLLAEINFNSSVRGLETNDLDLTIYPNPTTDILNLDINSQEMIEGKVSILDISGKEISTTFIDLSAGQHTISLPVETLPAGVYLLKVTSSTAQRTMKFIKGA